MFSRFMVISHRPDHPSGLCEIELLRSARLERIHDEALGCCKVVNVEWLNLDNFQKYNQAKRRQNWQKIPSERIS